MLATLCRIWFKCCGLAVLVSAVLAGLYIQELQKFREKSIGIRWVNWIGEFACDAAVAVERPQTLKEAQDAVQRYLSVRAAGTGHSFNTFACPSKSGNSAVIHMEAFREIRIDKQKTAVTAGAGIKMGQLQNVILAKGLTLRVPPGNPAYTVGGCIATGCHNLGQSHAQDLLAVTILLHNGTVRESKRGERDFNAAAVSIGMLGIILDVTLEVHPYRSLKWSSEQLQMPNSAGAIDILEGMSKRQTSQETVGNKLVFYPATEVIVMEHWVPTGRAADPSEPEVPLPPYVNSQPFRIGQGFLSHVFEATRNFVFKFTPTTILTMFQIPAELAFRGLHSSPELAKLRQAMGWQHSPEARGESSTKPTGLQYTWAGFLDETVNLLMGLRHIEVAFPLEPKDRAAKCLDIVFEHKHLAWWRLNVRTQKSEGFYVSTTHSDPAAAQTTFLRVDFVAPGGMLELDSGEKSLTDKLHSGCPGWRKHWGKGLFTTSAEEQWGDAEAFLEVVRRWDPSGKFEPNSNPSWLRSV